MIDAVDILVIYKSIINHVKDKIEDLELDMNERGLLVEIDLVQFSDLKKHLHYINEMVEYKCKKMAEYEAKKKDG